VQKKTKTKHRVLHSFLQTKSGDKGLEKTVRVLNKGLSKTAKAAFSFSFF